jgi:hypothetical protein
MHPYFKENRKKIAKNTQKNGFCAPPVAINLFIYKHLLASFAFLLPPGDSFGLVNHSDHAAAQSLASEPTPASALCSHAILAASHCSVSPGRVSAIFNS